MIHIDYRDQRTIYEQVKDEFKKLIFHGILTENEQIPPVRELASQLSINPNTIQRAYKELEADGYIYSIKGKGNFVCAPTQGDGSSERIKKLFTALYSTVNELCYLGVLKNEIINAISRKDGLFNDKSDKSDKEL